MKCIQYLCTLLLYVLFSTDFQLLMLFMVLFCHELTPRHWTSCARGTGSLKTTQDTSENYYEISVYRTGFEPVCLRGCGRRTLTHDSVAKLMVTDPAPLALRATSHALKMAESRDSPEDEASPELLNILYGINVIRSRRMAGWLWVMNVVRQKRKRLWPTSLCCGRVTGWLPVFGMGPNWGSAEYEPGMLNTSRDVEH
jgi:hypothetical protein